MIKQIVCSVVATSLVVSAALAGQPVRDYKSAPPPMPEPFYKAGEFTIGAYGMLSAVQRAGDFNDNTNWGAGLEGQYFFTRNFGVGLEGDYAYGPGGRPIWATAGNLYLRAPLSVDSRWAPYLFGGVGGVWFQSIGQIEGHLGGGLEYRVTRQIGLFGDGRYSWVDHRNNFPNYGLFRLGLRFVF